RPLPERLENFDSQLAADTKTRALYAILASWGAILLYLWFRFGSWTLGMAAVLCLMHDLFFTMGIIALSHYIHQWAPGLATVVGVVVGTYSSIYIASPLLLIFGEGSKPAPLGQRQPRPVPEGVNA